MSDTRARNRTGGVSVELDAMPPAQTRSLIESCITRLINRRQWRA
jgi:hypothetical protein